MSHILLQQVLEFHKKFNQTIGDPRYPNTEAHRQFRRDLIEEEMTELNTALDDAGLSDRQRVIQVADALGDLAYVIFGAAVSWGIDLASVIDAIHASNMTKSQTEKRQDGKVLKGPDYQPPQIEQTLELSAYEFNKTGGHENQEEDTWWPVPTAIQGEECFYPEQLPEEEPSQESTDKIMASAKDQAKYLAMKDIKQDFVPDTKSNGLTEDGRLYTTNSKAMENLKALGEKIIQGPSPDPFQEFLDSRKQDKISGNMTSYGAYVFECPCGRTHAVQAKLGSRGGLAEKGKAECMCGRAFVVNFHKDRDPVVNVTTIDELRKLNV